ncbi:MAG: hypothetical protein HY319_16785 [Armatimonadetes bacterium]|nr:hypothetical protein [Armatimonadota bacterium]
MSKIRMISILLLGMFLTAGPALAETRTPAVVSGLLVIASVDEQGNVTDLEILVEDAGEQEPYLVARTKKGGELMQYVDEWVVVAGTVIVDDLGWKTIEVDHYSLADQYPDPSKVVR